MNQATALNVLKAGRNVFLTGSAGAGKTYTLNQYIHYLKARKVPVAVTASTGIAATHMNGMTVHTWSGIGVRETLDDDDLARLYDRKYLRENLERVQVLIIDEISMLHGRQLGLVNQVLKYFKGSQQPFGGIQVVVAGDFFQLPPVSKSQERNRDKFAFMAPPWVEAGFQVCYLTEQHRQGSDPLNQILNEIRQGQVSANSLSLLQHTLACPSQDNHVQQRQLTRLYTHNVDVDAINQQQLAALKGKSYTYEASSKGNEKVLMTLTGSVRAPEQLTLKVGARVMFVRNDFERGYSNGTLGEVTSFVKTEEGQYWPRVRLASGDSLTVTPETWSVDNDQNKSLATYEQLPLCLAWAMTIHKSQGMTLQAAEIDLSQTFERGQGYVALSRLQTLSGLTLLGLNPAALELDTLAMRADARFQELSAQVAGQWQQEATGEHERFIRRCGGTLDQREIDRYLARQKPASAAKAKAVATTEQTRALFEAGQSVPEIAAARQLAESTIISHLVRLSLDGQKPLDIDRIRPPAAHLQAVQAVYDALLAEDNDDYFGQDGRIKVKPVQDALSLELSFNQIRLALAFIDI